MIANYELRISNYKLIDFRVLKLIIDNPNTG